MSPGSNSTAAAAPGQHVSSNGSRSSHQTTTNGESAFHAEESSSLPSSAAVTPEAATSQTADANLERTTSQILADDEHRALERHLTLFDLVSIGVGGTIGSGIFVLCGLIASEHAGPATCLSWAIAGVAAFLSGFCYAELSGRIPSAGSSYAYAHESMGEFVAFITAACLTLEFLVSGSAVARSWGDKVVEWLNVELNAGPWASRILDPGYNINPLAFVVSTCCTVLILCGVRESKIVTDFFTWTKVLLVLFMAIGGFVLLVPSNLSPFIPPEFGVAGVMRGATTSFFGYLGFDGICCVAGEAKSPNLNLPRSVMITLVLVTVLYIAAAVALTGMQHYTEISPESGFPEAFKARGVMWAAQLTAAGEICTLPVVVLISVILQPRLQYALARDELLPPMFCEVDAGGNIKKGTIVAGSLMTLIATFVPFEDLDDFVSAGILVAFTVTNSSLIVMRRESPTYRPRLLGQLLVAFNAVSLGMCITFVHGWGFAWGKLLALILAALVALTWGLIKMFCPSSAVFGGNRPIASTWAEGVEYFRTPFVPLIPCLGTIFNAYLIAQLDMSGILLLLLYFVISTAFYFYYRARKRAVRSRQRRFRRGRGSYEEVEMHQVESSEDAVDGEDTKQDLPAIT